jgi:hypothetical protein
MTCDEAKPLMFESWSHALGEAQELAFEAHLAGCETCRGEAERLGSLWNRLKMVPVEEPSVNLRSRFHETLAAYQHGLESAPRRSLRDRILSFWPKQPAWQMGVSLALLVIGLGVGYAMHPEKHEAPASTELAQLRGEISSMRQMVALSLMQEQSASERLRGVSWAYRVPSTDTEVLSALLTTVDQDPNVNVRLAAVDALHGFGASPVMRSAITQAIGKQTTPLVQIALIDLLVDLKEKESVAELRALADDSSADAGVRQHASQALEKLQ